MIELNIYLRNCLYNVEVKISQVSQDTEWHAVDHSGRNRGGWLKLVLVPGPRPARPKWAETTRPCSARPLVRLAIQCIRCLEIHGVS